MEFPHKHQKDNVMIKVQCRTNLDEYRQEEWPDSFAAPPSIGEHVQTKSGKWLRIVGITHCHERLIWADWHLKEQEERCRIPQPFLLVELNK